MPRVKDPAAQERADQPKRRRDEYESLVGPVQIAGPAVVSSVPVESASAVDTVDPVGVGTERGEPHQADENVQRVVHEGPGEGDEPDQAQDSGEGSDADSVEFATPWAGAVGMVNPHQCARHADDNDGARELQGANANGDDA